MHSVEFANNLLELYFFSKPMFKTDSIEKSEFKYSSVKVDMIKKSLELIGHYRDTGMNSIANCLVYGDTIGLYTSLVKYYTRSNIRSVYVSRLMEKQVSCFADFTNYLHDGGKLLKEEDFSLYQIVLLSNFAKLRIGTQFNKKVKEKIIDSCLPGTFIITDFQLQYNRLQRISRYLFVVKEI